jgi:chromosome segregation ATPase
VSLITALQWRIIAVLAGLVFMGGLYSAGFVKGRAAAEARCQAEALRAEIAELTRQREAAELVIAEATRVYEEQQREIAELNAEAQAYADQLAHADGCRLTDDDVRRLRAIQ